MSSLRIPAVFMALALAVEFALAADPTLPSQNLLCYDSVSPNSRERVPVACLPSYDSRDSFAVAIPLTAPTVASATGAPPLPTSTVGPAVSGFKFDYACASSGSRTDFCNKTIAAFETCGRLLSDIFNIKATISVQVSIREFCPNLQCSNGDQSGQLGNAAPTRNVPLTSDDGVVRLYPQALAKQFGMPIAYSEYDIAANINGNSTAWGIPWFAGDPLPAPGNSIQDVQYVVLHELLHGLGFTSGWDFETVDGQPAYMPNLLTDGTSYVGFTENIYDRFVVQMSSNSERTQVVSQLNGVAFPGSTVQSLTNGNWINNNAQIMAAITPLGNLAQTANSFAFRGLSNGVDRYLESSFNPYRPSSSASHIDLKTYQSSSDFLMTYEVNDAGTLSQLIAKFNDLLSDAQLTDASLVANIDQRLALGPGTRAIMASIGWPMRKDSDPVAAPSTAVTGSVSSTLTQSPIGHETARYRRRTVQFVHDLINEDL